VPHTRRDLHQEVAPVAEDDRLRLASGRRALPVVIQPDLHLPLEGTEVVGLLLVLVPGLHDWPARLRIARGDIRLAEADEVRVVGPQDLHQEAAVIDVPRQPDELDSVDHTQNLWKARPKHGRAMPHSAARAACPSADPGRRSSCLWQRRRQRLGSHFASITVQGDRPQEGLRQSRTARESVGRLLRGSHRY